MSAVDLIGQFYKGVAYCFCFRDYVVAVPGDVLPGPDVWFSGRNWRTGRPVLRRIVKLRTCDDAHRFLRLKSCGEILVVHDLNIVGNFGGFA